jgi:branched-chain amino acid transport system substrate-binding protein
MGKMGCAAVRLRGFGLAGLLIVAGIGQATADDVIILGAAVSATGKYALNGANTKNGYDFAIEAINAKGGVAVDGKRYKLSIRYYDDESTPARGIELAERLVRQDGVRFILGPYGPGLTKAMLPIVERYRVPMIEANTASRELFTRGYRYIFAVPSTADEYLAGAVDLAAEQAEKLGKRPSAITVALAMENDAFTQDVRNGVLDEIRRQGMKVVIDDQLPPELDDMSTTLARVKMLKPDLLLVSGHEKGAQTAVSQIRERGVYVPMVVMTHCDSARIAELGAAAEHTFCPHQWHESLNYRDATIGSAAEFAEAFKGRHGYEAPYQAAQSAAAILVFADAFARAQTLEPEKVRDAIAATDLQTFFGRIKFDATGKNIAKPMVLTQVRAGRYVVVAPKEWAGAEPVIPRPKP